MELEISSVGILEISPYMKSEQHSLAGKHLTRHANNYYAVVAWRAMFLVGSAIAAAVADKPIRIIKAILEAKGFLCNVNNCKK